MNKKLILIDGHSILNRAFYGVPDLTNSEGIHTNALYGFLNIMFKFLDEEKPDYITVAFDLSTPTFRHKVFDKYKGTRKPMAAELKQQVPLIKEILQSMNITIIEKEGYEADDLIGTIAKKAAADGIDVSVISGDRDLLQLSMPNIKIRIPKTKKGVTEVEDYLPEDVYKEYGVTPLEFIDLKALMGDSSDNIPGAPGIGPKTASSIIQKYHSIEEVFNHIDELTPPKAKKSVSENIEQIKLSKYLATINITAPIEYDINKSTVHDFFNHNSYEMFKRFNFKSMLKRFDNSQIENEIKTSNGLLSKYKIKKIDDLSDAENIFTQARNTLNNKRIVGINILSAGTDSVNMCNYGISLTFSNEISYFIPIGGFITSEYLNSNIVKLSNECKDRSLIIINLKEHLGMFYKNSSNNYVLSLNTNSFYDISLAAYLLNPSNDNYDYDDLARAFLHENIPSRQELLGKDSIEGSLEANIDNLCKYSCYKSIVAYLCHLKVNSLLIEEDMFSLYKDIEMPLLFVLSYMEQAGVRIDKASLKEYGEKLQVRITELEKEIYELAGESFNINSPKQLGIVLFEKMKLPNGKKTKSGYSTAADVLEKLSNNYPVVNKILEYRQLTKLKSTYADGLAGYIKEDGRIHGKFNQTITATGRISSTEPNLQNIPIRMELGRQIRKVFIPQDGFVFIDADYSQIELRILAHMSQDANLINAYNSAQDIHKITASQVFHVPFDEVTPLQRRNAKAVNFGIIYGISSFGLSQDLSISKKQANEYIEQYFATYPAIKSYIDGLVSFAKENGYSLTLFKRRRPIPELKSSNFMQRSFGERVAMNAPIQGTAADIIKLAMIKVHESLIERNLKSRLILQVHDELLVEAAIDEVEEVKQIISDSMKHAASLKVSLEIDMKEGHDWLEAH